MASTENSIAAIESELTPTRLGLPVLDIENLEQRLQDPERPEQFVVYVRDRITIRQGDFVALLGPSGCGKTTLLTVLGLLRAPSSPESLTRFTTWEERNGVRHEIDLKAAWTSKRYGSIERLRRKNIGFALQSGELLPALTVAENIAAPLHLNGVDRTARNRRVRELIDIFGLRKQEAHRIEQGPPGDESSSKLMRSTQGYDLSHARVNKLSGGEYQRVSLARAIAHRPSIVFVDEPTSALNREMARGALKQFQQLQVEEGARGATIMITHDEELAGEFANIVIRMAPMKGRAAGEVVEVITQPTTNLS